MPLGTALSKTYGGKALDGLGGVAAYQLQSNWEYHMSTDRSETAGDKVRSREGNSPDQQLRSQNTAECKMMCDCEDSQEVGLEAAKL